MACPIVCEKKMAKLIYKDYEINDDKELLQLKVVHHLLKDTYWCQGIPFETVENSAKHSFCYGVYHQGQQVGFARVVTDQSTFAWLSDVIIDPKHRGQGLGLEMVRFILTAPYLKKIRRICLATQDAHTLYQKLGFKVTATPQNWMEIKDNQIYLR